MGSLQPRTTARPCRRGAAPRGGRGVLLGALLRGSFIPDQCASGVRLQRVLRGVFRRQSLVLSVTASFQKNAKEKKKAARPVIHLSGFPKCFRAAASNSDYQTKSCLFFSQPQNGSSRGVLYNQAVGSSAGPGNTEQR